MKKITFRNLQLDERETVKDVMNAVMANSPAKPIEINEIRRRVKVMDAIERMDGNTLLVEDGDYTVLKTAFSAFPWQRATKSLVQLIDDIEAAEDVSFLKVVEKSPPSSDQEEKKA